MDVSQDGSVWKEKWKGGKPGLYFFELDFQRAVECLRFEELPQEEFIHKHKKLQEIYRDFQYVTGEKCPLVDASIGLAIQNYFGIKMPEK